VTLSAWFHPIGLTRCVSGEIGGLFVKHATEQVEPVGWLHRVRFATRLESVQNDAEDRAVGNDTAETIVRVRVATTVISSAP